MEGKGKEEERDKEREQGRGERGRTILKDGGMEGERKEDERY